MARKAVPVTLGSARFRGIDVGGIVITEAWFPAGLVLEPHTHDRPCFAVMLAGSFDVVFRGVRHASTGSTFHTEPVGERHANHVGNGGAHVIVLQPDPARVSTLGEARRVLQGIACVRHGGVGDLALRVVRELSQPDEVSRLAIEAHALEMLALASRAHAAGPHAPPAWLRQVEAEVRERWDESLRVSELALHAGVHPAHLARAFRAHYGMSLGSFVRRLRLDWATDQLRGSDAPIAGIAAAAGFSDQSHFTRLFRERTGATPAHWRARVRR